MKKRTIIALVVAVLLIVVGGIMLILGFSYAGEVSESTLTEQTIQIIPVMETFNSVVIDTKDCNVKFMPYNGDVDGQVTLLQKEAVNHSVVIEDGVLKIKMVDDRKWTDYIGSFNVYGASEEMEMTVYLPNIQYVSIRVTTDTGDVKIPGILQAEEMQVRSDTGDVWVEGGPVEMLDCLLSTGDITVRGGQGMFMKLRTDTGDLDIRDFSGEELHLSSNTGQTDIANVSVRVASFNGDTGEVELENVQAEYLQVFTDTGDIDVENSSAQTVNIETSTGNIAIPADWQFQRIETGTGKIKYE